MDESEVPPILNRVRGSRVTPRSPRRTPSDGALTHSHTAPRAPQRGDVASNNDFPSRVHGNNDRCRAGHIKNAPAVFNPCAGHMISTLALSQSSKEGCPWCAILWEAFKGMSGFSIPDDQEFIYWRYAGESFFEPWCTIQGRSSFKIQIYTPPSYESTREVPQLPMRNTLNRRTDSAETMNQIDIWRRQCSQCHPNCEPDSLDVPLPTRCVDVSNVEAVRVVNTKGLRGKYCCLSHRWGYEEMPVQLTRSTLSILENGTPLDTLPRTFQDAVVVTRRMKCQYLWIDSLCIIQGDAEDWEVEAAQMASTYRNSLLTIAAAAAIGAIDGLFHTAAPGFSGQNLPLELSAHNIPFPVYVRSYLRYAVGHLLPRDQQHWLLRRGWILQERLLSPRIVYFGYNEVAWECMTATGCECQPELAPYQITQHSPREPFNPKAAFSESIRNRKISATGAAAQSLGLWHHIVNTYTGLDLTVSRDKFPALAGLAVQIGQMRGGDKYLSGLWRKTLMADILWRKRKIEDWHASAFNEHHDLHNVFDASDEGKPEFERDIRHRGLEEVVIRHTVLKDLAPSWSWASVHMQVEYDKDISLPNLGLENPEFANLVDFSCAHKHQTGLLESPETVYLTLRSKFVAVICERELVEYRTQYRMRRGEHILVISESDYHPSDWPCPINHRGTLYCLRIAEGRMKNRPHMARVYGLVLTERDRQGENVYQRVGMFQASYEHGKEWSIFDGVDEMTDVKIV